MVKRWGLPISNVAAEWSACPVLATAAANSIVQCSTFERVRKNAKVQLYR